VENWQRFLTMEAFISNFKGLIMTIKKMLQLGAASSLLLASFGASAQWTGSLSYQQYSLDDDGISVDLGAITASIGYRFKATDNFYLVPEFRVGFGVGDDTVRVDTGDGIADVKVELDRLWGFSNRFQYEFETPVYVFGVVSYVNYKAEAKFEGFSESDDSWETSLGAGAGYMFTPLFGGEVSYERVDGEDLWTIGARFNF